MPEPDVSPALPSGDGAPLVGGGPLHVGLRYLRRKRLAILAMLGVALSVGTIIVVMSVFAGFSIQMKAAIRGYLSHLTIKPAGGGQFGMTDWRGWGEQVRNVEHVEAVAPFAQGFALMRPRGATGLQPILFRGVDPELEGQVADLPRYMQIGKLKDLTNTYADPQRPEAPGMPACIVGAQFPGFAHPFQLFDPQKLDVEPGQIVLVTATDELSTRLNGFAVNGLFKTGYDDFDRGYAIMSLDAAMDLAATGGAVTGLNVRLDDYENADAVKALLEARLSPGAELRALGTTESALRVAVSDDGSHVAALTDAGDVVVWNASDGQETARVAAGQSPPAAFALGPDGTRLALGRADGTVQVVEVATGREVGALPAGAAVTALACSPDTFLLAVGRADGHVAVVDAELEEDADELEEYASATVGNGPIRVLAFDSFSEQVLVAGSGGRAAVLGADGEESPVNLIPLGTTDLTAAAFSPDRTQVLAGDTQGRVGIWNAGTGELQNGWQADRTPVAAVSFGARPGELLTAGPNDIRAWALRDDESLWIHQIINVGMDTPHHTVFLSDRRHLVRVDESGRPRVIYCGPRFGVETWEDQQATLLSVVEMEGFLQGLIMSLILVMAEFFIFSIVTGVVNERRRDVGILKAIGYTRSQICAVFLLVGTTIGTLGAAIGVTGGMLFAHYIESIRVFIRWATEFDPFPAEMYYFTEVPHHTELRTVLLTAGGAIVCSILFSLIPALRAARLDPVRTLHYE